MDDKKQKQEQLEQWRADQERYKLEALSSIEAMTEEIKDLLELCQQTAKENGIQFHLDLLDTRQYREPIWNSSTGHCGWLNPGEGGYYPED